MTGEKILGVVFALFMSVRACGEGCIADVDSNDVTGLRARAMETCCECLATAIVDDGVPCEALCRVGP